MKPQPKSPTWANIILVPKQGTLIASFSKFQSIVGLQKTKAFTRFSQYVRLFADSIMHQPFDIHLQVLKQLARITYFLM